MNRTRFRPLLAAFLLLSMPAFAQTSIDALPPSNPTDEAIQDIIDHGPQGIDIAPDRRADLSGCGGTTAAGVLQAIRSCWPVLETYRANAPMVAAAQEWMRLPPVGQAVASPQSRAAATAAERMIAETSLRRYPAQDVPLMIAHMSLAFIGRAQGDLEGAISHLTAARDIHKSSRITAAKFTGGGEEIDRQIAETRAQLTSRGASSKN